MCIHTVYAIGILHNQMGPTSVRLLTTFSRASYHCGVLKMLCAAPFFCVQDNNFALFKRVGKRVGIYLKF